MANLPQKGLKVTDRIAIHVITGDALCEAVKEHHAFIMHHTLCDDLVLINRNDGALQAYRHKADGGIYLCHQIEPVSRRSEELLSK